MQIKLPTANEYINDKRPVNFRPLVSFASFFSLGILTASKIDAVFSSVLVLITVLLAFIVYALSYKRTSLCIAAFALGIARLVIANLCGNVLDSLLSRFADLFTPLRDALTENTTLLFPDDSGILCSMLWGDKSGIVHYQREIFNGAGIAHILALSGLHVSFFISLFTKIIPKHMHRLRFFFCAGFLLFYCSIAAFPASLMRASLMSLLVIGAQLLHERYDAPNSISLAALIILLISPLELFDLGFQMSFAAVIGIVLIYPTLSRTFHRFFPHYLAENISVSVSATAGVMPISINAFSNFAVYSIFGNIFLLPFVSVLVICAFAAVIISFAYFPLASLIAFLAQFVYDAIFTFSSFLCSLPFSVIDIIMPIPVGICMYCIIFVMSDFYFRKPLTKTVIITLLCILALILSLVI